MTTAFTARRLLLVEDNPADADLVQELLDDTSRDHYAVVHVTRVAEALSALRRQLADVVLLDLHLPDAHGIDTVKSVHSAAEEVPIIVLTGLHDEDLALACIDAGAQDYLCKGEMRSASLRRAIDYAINRRHEVRLRQQQLQNLVLASPDAMVVTDAGGIIHFANDAAVALFATPRENLLAQPLGFPVHEGVTTKIEVPRPRDPRVAEMRVAATEWKGKPAYLASIRDMTDQRRLEEQLRQVQKMDAIGRLAGGVAHDFNNLLTIILGYTETLLTDPGTIPLNEGLDEIRKAADRAAALTGQLLAFSRKSVLAPVSLDLNALVANLGKMLPRLIGEDISLKIESDPSLGHILADPSQLEQVIMNLVVNARDAMPKGGHLTLATQHVDIDEPFAGPHAPMPPGPYALLSVSDDGVGMSRETQSRLFEPFFTTKDVGKGTGLGLATVYGIVKQSAGHIIIYSELGHGTSVKIYMPCLTAPPAAAAAQTTRPTLTTGTETILLVEDEDSLRALTRTILETCGYRVVTARDGNHALQEFAKHTGAIDMVVTDVVMPNKSGPQLVLALRARVPQLKVLYVSGYTDDAIIRHGIMHQETAFLQKPFTPASLAKKVREVLDTPVPPTP